MEDQKPIVLRDLANACSSLAQLISCSWEWIPQERLSAFASAVWPHLEAARTTIAAAARNNGELLELCRENRTAEVVETELAHLAVLLQKHA